MFVSLRGAVLSFERLSGAAMALAYGQVNASFAVVVSGDQSSSEVPVKKWSAGLVCG